MDFKILRAENGFVVTEARGYDEPPICGRFWIAETPEDIPAILRTAIQPDFQVVKGRPEDFCGEWRRHPNNSNPFADDSKTDYRYGMGGWDGPLPEDG